MVNYYLLDKGRRAEVINQAGKAILEYMKEGHTTVNSAEIREMVAGIPNAEEELQSLHKAGFLGKEDDEDFGEGPNLAQAVMG